LLICCPFCLYNCIEMYTIVLFALQVVSKELQIVFKIEFGTQ